MIPRRLAAAAAVAVALVVSWAAVPVGADDAVTIDSPAAGNEVVTIRGTVADPATIGKLSVVVSKDGQEVARCDQTPDPADQVCGAKIGLAQLGQPPTAFSFQTRLRYNGQYTVTVTADRGLLGASSGSKDFKVAAPPAPPANVKATRNPDGTVTVTWDPNHEPDLIGYQVKRTNPDGSKVDVPGPSDIAHPSVTDADAANVGGFLRYSVTAKRPDAEAATVTSILLPLPGGPGGGPPAVGGGAGPSRGAIGRGGGAIARGGGAAPTAAEPDGTFSSTLPFPAQAAGDALAGESGGEGPAVRGRRAGANARALLLPVAAGLFLCVAGFHMRLFNRRVLAAPESPYLPIADDDVADSPEDSPYLPIADDGVTDDDVADAEEPAWRREPVLVGQARSPGARPYDYTRTWGTDSEL